MVQLSSAGGAVRRSASCKTRSGARRTIQIALLIWIAVCVAVWATHSKQAFWVIALFAGLGIGSLQSASRGLVGMFSPASKSGEFFGFWGLAGKGAYAVGPFVFGLVSKLSGSQRTAMLGTLVFFAAGFIALYFVDEAKGRAAAASWSEPEPTEG